MADVTQPNFIEQSSEVFEYAFDNSVDLPPSTHHGVELNTLTIPKAYLRVTEPKEKKHAE